MSTDLNPAKAKASTYGSVQSRAAAAAIELRGIDKRFGNIHANRAIDLSVKSGTIHGIVGENGAGKSTLMKILYGYYQADAGEIFVDGSTVSIARPEDAIAHGIGMVHQHFMLVDNFTVLENLVLGAEDGFWVGETLSKARERLSEIQREYGLHLNPDTLVEELPVGLQQRAEILKLLIRGAQVIVLDEPTAVLTPQETDELFKILKRLTAEGKTVILITHKLQEILAVTDEVTVMRDGAVVGKVETAHTSKEELAEMMVGRPVLLRVEKGPAQSGAPILEMRGVTLRSADGAALLDDINLEVRAGEILGIAGVSGNGQSELLECLSGLRPPQDGEIDILATAITSSSLINDPRALRKLGVGHVPEDRLRMGIIVSFDASESALLGYHDDPAYNGRIFADRGKILAHCQSLMQAFDVRPAEPRWRSGAFSGGNQQKLVLAREMERHPSLLLVGQPTRGVDIGAIEFIHKRLIEMRDAGTGILLVSAELEEIMALSDRIAVMSQGRIVGTLAANEVSTREIGLMMAGDEGTHAKCA